MGVPPLDLQCNGDGEQLLLQLEINSLAPRFQ